MPIYRRALKYFLPEWLWIALLSILMLILVGLGTLQAWPLALLIDVLSLPESTGDGVLSFFGRSNRVAEIALIIVAFFVIKLLQDILSLCRSMVSLRVKYSATLRVRKVLYSHLHALGSTYFKTQPQGDAIYRVTNDTYGPYGIFDTFLGSIQAAASLIAVALIMYIRSAPLTLFAFSLAPLLVLANWHFGKTIKLRTTESRQIDADLTTVIQRTLTTLGLTQMFGRQNREEQRFHRAQVKSVDAALRLNWQENLYPLAVQTIYGLGQISIYGFGAYLVYSTQTLTGAQRVTCGDLVLFVTYFNQILDPLSMVFGFGARVKGSVAATERVFSVLDSIPAVRDAENAIAIEVKPRDLILDKVWFGYGSESSILCGMSATILAGQMVAFVGPSGTGKSTVLSLLTRFHDPSSGQILLGGFDLRQLRLDSVRRHMAVVSQDSSVLAGTVLENIKYGKASASESEVQQAAAMAGADQFIETLPQRYETQIAEGGQNLSGGQRQRIAIARALLADSPILILDEPTSALDRYQEHLFMLMLKKLKGSRTIILVTHRLDTVMDCDQIFVMRHGRIFEQGTHAELMALQGLYFASFNAHEECAPEMASEVIPSPAE